MAKNESHEGALIRQIMDEYMETEGARLQREFDAAEARGEVPDVPAALDAACRKMIQDHIAKQ